MLLFSSVRPDHIAGQGSSYFIIKVITKKDAGKGTTFFSADSMLNTNLTIKVSATALQGCQPLCKTAALRLR